LIDAQDVNLNIIEKYPAFSSLKNTGHLILFKLNIIEYMAQERTAI